MSQFDAQSDALGKICQIVHVEADSKYEKIILDAKYNVDEGWTDFKFEFYRDSIKINRGISFDRVSEAHDLVKQLYFDMKSHTGGKWSSFTLTLDAEGKANVKFHYSENK